MHARVTVRDTKLAHQIDLRSMSGQQSFTQVFCNCRKEPLGKMGSGDDPWPIYNNVELHNNSVEQFVPGQSTAVVMDVQ